MRLLGRLKLDKQRRLLIGAILVVTALLVFLLAKSYLGFKNAEQGWQAYSDRHVQLTTELAALRQHFGYGGLIHNFKNLVLRRDPARYQAAIENNIINLQQALAALSVSVDKPAAAAALQTVADTINLYIKNYRITLQMIASGADSATIDAAVKVSDISAYHALAQLDQYLADTRHQLGVETERQSRQALYFMLSGVVLLLPLMLIVSSALLMFLQQLMLQTQQATEAEAALNHLFQGTPDPMLIVDAKGQVLQSNQLAQQLFGVVALQLPGVHISHLLRLESGSSSMQQFAALLSGLSGEEPLIVPARAADGEVRILSVTYAKTQLGRSAVFIMNLRDVTGRLAEQAALEFAKEQAERALQRQQEMQQQLINAEKMASLSKMVAGVAHEVNTPLGVMLTASSLLHDDTLLVCQQFNDATLSKSRLQQYLDMARETTTLIRDTCLQTGELISHFKQVAVDQSGTERRRFNLPKYLQELLVTLAPAWESSGVVVRLDGPVLLEMDSYPGAVAQVVTNLLMNALQHAYQPEVGGEVIIAIAANPANPGWVDIMVRDEGAGIGSAEQSQVFEPFFTTTRVKGNTGLGLHIVYSTVQMVLRGLITLDSTPGQGCTFKVSLPLSVDDANLPGLLQESSAYQSESIRQSGGAAQQQDDESEPLSASPAKLSDVLPTARVLPLRAS